MTNDVSSSQRDHDLLCDEAKHRDLWKDLVSDITNKHYELWHEKEIKKRDARRKECWLFCIHDSYRFNCLV